MEQSKVSVIIPIFNAGMYLERCLNSIFLQTYDNYEIILVDDGSKDNSGEICDKYSEEYKNITVIHKKNTGISDSRNIGLEHSSGKWIMFCDADDTVESDWISTLVEATEENSNKLVNCEYRCLDINNGNIKEIKIPNVYKSTVFGLEDYYLFYKYGYCPYVWNRIYNLDIIKSNKLKFDISYKVGGEDVVFNLNYLQYCDGFYYIPKHCYNWINNGSSMSRDYHPEFFYLRERLYQIRKPYIAPKYLKDYYDTCFYYFYEVLNNIIKNGTEKILDKYKMCKYILSSDAFIETIKLASSECCGEKLKKILSTKSVLLVYLLISWHK